MFKKLSELFFGEVEEEIEVEEFPQEEAKPVVKPVKEVKPISVAQEIEEPVKTEEPKKQKSIFIDSSTPKKKHTEKKPVLEVEESYDDYEFTPVISPIKGIKDQEGITVKSTPKRKSQPTKASSRLGTVLSPYHGLGKGQNPGTLPEAESLEEEVVVYDEKLRDEIHVETEKIEAVSLEEMLSEDGPNLFTTAELHLKDQELEHNEKKEDDSSEFSEE